MKRFYVFSGIDGAGKSTQIQLLKEYLEVNKKEKVRILWSRGGYTPVFQALKNLLKVSRQSSSNVDEQSKTRERQLGNPIISRIWLLMAIVDLMIYYAIYFRWLRLRKFTVIADRYIDDTQMDFDLNFPKVNYKEWLIWKIFLKLIPRPVYSFLLIIPVEESIRRSKLKDEPFPDTKETLEKRLEMYSMFPISTYERIDCLQPIETIQSEIRINIAE